MNYCNKTKCKHHDNYFNDGCGKPGNAELSRQCMSNNFNHYEPADLPEAGASAERISSVVRSNATVGWIKVSERSPEINIPVLAIIPDVHYPAYAFRANNADEYMVYYTGGVKRCNTVTHWMPLPEPPEV